MYVIDKYWFLGMLIEHFKLVKVYSKTGRSEWEERCFYINNWTPVL